MKRKNGNVRFYEFGNCYDYNIDNKKEDETLAQFSEDYRLGSGSPATEWRTTGRIRTRNLPFMS